MKKDDYLIYGFAALILLILSYSIYGFWFSGQGSDKTLTLKAISSGSTDNGDVLIALTPVNIAKGKLYVSISANTHSVDLSQFNLKNMVSLNYNGKTAKPVEASSLTGHHVSGELIFPVKGDLEEFDIVILGVPKTNERRFEWRS